MTRRFYLEQTSPMGEPSPERAQDERAARVSAARANAKWQELPRERLELGKFRMFVDLETGTKYRLHRGAVFVGPRLEFGDQAPLAFYIADSSGEPAMLERA